MKTPWRPFVESFTTHFWRPALGAALVAVAAFAIASVMPVWYQAETTLLPPRETESSFGLLASLIESSALSRVGLVTTSSPADVYVEIMKSRRVREKIIERFGLRERYKRSNLDLCLKALDAHVESDVKSTKILVLRVEDQNPKLAADMANTIVAELDSFNRSVQLERALRTQAYLDGQLVLVQGRLRAAEASLTDYERRTGVVVQAEQAAVSGAAELIARRMDLQVRRTWLQSFSRPSDPGVSSIDAELQAIEREVSRLPGLKQEAARRALDVEIQRRVYTLITAQLEEARLEGARDLPTVTVLDPARPPLVRHRPRRIIVVAVAGAIALLLAAAWAAVRARRDLQRAGLLIE